MKVKSIKLKSFRGATQTVNVNFDTSKSLSLIFGENGSGKTTIVDAFDFLCNKKFGSIDEYSMGRQAKNYIASYGCNEECTVEIISEFANWQAKLNGSDIAVNPNKSIPNARILRRRTILSLIEQTPKDRFDSLKLFISVPNTDKTETVIRSAITETKNQFDECVRSISDAEEALDLLWIENGRLNEKACSWAEILTKKPSNENQELAIEIDELLTLISNTESAFADLKYSIASEDSAIKSEEDAKLKLKKFEANQKEKDADLFSLLQKAESYLRSHSYIDKCPICDTHQVVKKMLDNVSSKISEMPEIKSFAINVQNTASLAENKKTLRVSNEASFLEKLKKLMNTIEKLPQEVLVLLNINKTFIKDGIAVLVYDKSLFDLFHFWHKDFESSNKSKVNEMRNELLKQTSLKSTIQKFLDMINEKNNLAKTKAKVLEELKVIHEVIEKERKDYIDNILNSISQEVSTLYTRLHPEEKIGKARFYLKPNVIGSLEFDATFEEAEEIPPQAYYSESHLDTLGICVFIALAKHYKSDNTILILDDVLTSIDAQHMDRFMTLLHEQSSSFNQIIVTTHYRPWKERYKHSRGSIANIDVIELGNWTYKSGIQVSQFKLTMQELKESIKTPNLDRQIVASKAGIVLESILDFISLKYGCLLPHNNRNEYTLGDFVNGIDSKLSKILKIKKDGIEIELKPMLDASVSQTWIRNCVGCHFTLNSDITNHDVKGFAKAVISIAETIICAKCESLPKKHSGSFWHCACRENYLELHPLVQPGAQPRIKDNDE